MGQPGHGGPAPAYRGAVERKSFVEITTVTTAAEL